MHLRACPRPQSDAAPGRVLQASKLASERRKFANEMRLMSCIHHRNIVHCFGGNMATQPGKLDFMVLEFVVGGTLDAYVHEVRRARRLSVAEVRVSPSPIPPLASLC